MSKELEEKIKQLEEENKRLKSIIDKNTDNLHNIANSISHNFSNLLQPIIGYSQLAELKPEKTLEYAKKRIKQTSKLTNLVNEIQHFANANRKMDTDLINAVHPIECGIQLIGEESKISRNYADDVPDVCVNVYELQQVYQNILQNALEANAKKIIVVLHKNNGHVYTRIVDDGDGIEQENIKKIFEPFYSTRKDVGHLGLGLATCKAVVEKYNGEILVKSRLGDGSDFTVVLPIAKKEL